MKASKAAKKGLLLGITPSANQLRKSNTFNSLYGVSKLLAHIDTNHFSDTTYCDKKTQGPGRRKQDDLRTEIDTK
jgi:hypothetical protein